MIKIRARRILFFLIAFELMCGTRVRCNRFYDVPAQQNHKSLKIKLITIVVASMHLHKRCKRTETEENLSEFGGKRVWTGFIFRVDVSYGQSLRTNANFIEHYMCLLMQVNE